MVVSPGWAGRPPSLLTYSLLPIRATSRGAAPTCQVCVSLLVAVSRATTVFCPLSGTYSVLPSAEGTALPGRAEVPLTAGKGTDVGAPRVPSPFTGNLVRP